MDEPTQKEEDAKRVIVDGALGEQQLVLDKLMEGRPVILHQGDLIDQIKLLNGTLLRIASALERRH